MRGAILFLLAAAGVPVAADHRYLPDHPGKTAVIIETSETPETPAAPRPREGWGQEITGRRLNGHREALANPEWFDAGRARSELQLVVMRFNWRGDLNLDKPVRECGRAAALGDAAHLGLAGIATFPRARNAGMNAGMAS